MIKEAAPDQNVIQLKSLEAFAKAADGKATKIIIPSEIQGIAGLAKSVTEIAADQDQARWSRKGWAYIMASSRTMRS